MIPSRGSKVETFLAQPIAENLPGFRAWGKRRGVRGSVVLDTARKKKPGAYRERSPQRIA
jgi:hypothetical protein